MRYCIVTAKVSHASKSLLKYVQCKLAAQRQKKGQSQVNKSHKQIIFFELKIEQVCLQSGESNVAVVSYLWWRNVSHIKQNLTGDVIRCNTCN